VAPIRRAGEHRDHGLGDHRQVDRDPVAGRDAELEQRVRALLTSRLRSAYVIVRVSPGSPSKWSATRSPLPASTCRSTQL
jgi:hypothetical protein